MNLVSDYRMISIPPCCITPFRKALGAYHPAESMGWEATGMGGHMQ
jgi:hypothetical protein